MADCGGGLAWWERLGEDGGDDEEGEDDNNVLDVSVGDKTVVGGAVECITLDMLTWLEVTSKDVEILAGGGGGEGLSQWDRLPCWALKGLFKQYYTLYPQ